MAARQAHADRVIFDLFNVLHDFQFKEGHKKVLLSLLVDTHSRVNYLNFQVESLLILDVLASSSDILVGSKIFLAVVFLDFSFYLY